jgi:peptidoglycan/LPS O-acetylase OafA/YrhL
MHALERLFLMHWPSAGCATILALTILLAAVSWHCFEKPILRKCTDTARVRRKYATLPFSSSDSALQRAELLVWGTLPKID